MAISNNMANRVTIMANSFEKTGMVSEKVADDFYEIAKSYEGEMKGIRTDNEVLVYAFHSITNSLIKGASDKGCMLCNHLEYIVHPFLASSYRMAVNTVHLANRVKAKMDISEAVIKECRSSAISINLDLSMLSVYNNKITRDFHNIIDNIHLINLYDDVTSMDFMDGVY